jgi:hypothetical protein
MSSIPGEGISTGWYVAVKKCSMDTSVLQNRMDGYLNSLIARLVQDSRGAGIGRVGHRSHITEFYSYQGCTWVIVLGDCVFWLHLFAHPTLASLPRVLICVTSPGADSTHSSPPSSAWKSPRERAN